MEGGGMLAANETDRGGRGVLAPEQVGHRDLVQIVEADAEGLILIGEGIEVGPVKEQGQVRPGIAGEEVGLAVVEAEAVQNLKVGEHLLGVKLVVEELRFPIPPPV